MQVVGVEVAGNYNWEQLSHFRGRLPVTFRVASASADTANRRSPNHSHFGLPKNLSASFCSANLGMPR